MQEFEQLQIISGLEEETEHTMARFLKGLDPNTTEKVELHLTGPLRIFLNWPSKLKSIPRTKGHSLVLIHGQTHKPSPMFKLRSE